LQKRLQTGGAFLVNINDVAKAAGVSTSTVSRVLTRNAPVSDEARARVLAAVEKMNYQPNAFAQGLKGGSLHTIGLVIPNVRNLVFPAAIRGIEDTAGKNGYTVVLCNTDENIEKERFYIDNLRRRLIDGFIFSTARPGHEYLLDLPAEGVPVVFLLRQMGKSVNTVALDNEGGAYEATRYMLSRGLKQIAFINGGLDLPLYRDRYEGYLRAMREAKVTEPSHMVVHGISGWDDGYQVMKDILEEGCRPDAVFATSDPKAMGIIRAIRDMGLRVPEDISVMGFDNLDFSAQIDPPLTTVAQPFYEMGVRACRRLIDLIEKGRTNKPKVEVLPAKLVIRKSVR
jgi:LacI family transcriptional regulator